MPGQAWANPPLAVAIACELEICREQSVGCHQQALLGIASVELSFSADQSGCLEHIVHSCKAILDIAITVLDITITVLLGGAHQMGSKITSNPQTYFRLNHT